MFREASGASDEQIEQWNAQVKAWMALFPEQITFTMPDTLPLKFFLFFSVCFLVGIFMYFDMASQHNGSYGGYVQALFPSGFLVFGSAWFLIRGIPLIRNPSLRSIVFRQRDLTIRRYNGTFVYRWDQIESFETYSIRTKGIIADYGVRFLMAAKQRGGSIPSCKAYGVEPVPLTMLLMLWRQRGLEASHEGAMPGESVR